MVRKMVGDSYPAFPLLWPADKLRPRFPTSACTMNAVEHLTSNGGVMRASIAKVHGKGRGLLATCDAPGMSSILEEYPFEMTVVDDDKAQYHFCHSCLDGLQTDGPSCKECNISAFCSTQCATKSRHSDFECQVFSKFREVFQSNQVGYAMRMLVKILSDYCIAWPSNQPEQGSAGGEIPPASIDELRNERLKKFMGLCTNSSAMKQSPWHEHYLQRCALIASMLVEMKVSTPELDKYISEIPGGPDIVSVLYDMMCRIHCNAFGVKNLAGDDCGNAIFLTSAFLNHSCDPSAYISPTTEKMVVTARGDLSPGDEILISYNSERDPTKRRDYLSSNYFFECRCDKCIDEGVAAESSDADGHNSQAEDT